MPLSGLAALFPFSRDRALPPLETRVYGQMTFKYTLLGVSRQKQLAVSAEGVITYCTEGWLKDAEFLPTCQTGP
jgi:hypothetical protein